MKKRVLMFAAALALSSAPAMAHHSFAQFDREREVQLEGTVVEFQWTNPHVWIEVAVPAQGSGPSQWSVEGGSPMVLGRQGWSRSLLKVGDRVSVVIHPMKDGSKGGSLQKLVLANGRSFAGVNGN